MFENWNRNISEVNIFFGEVNSFVGVLSSCACKLGCDLHIDELISWPHIGYHRYIVYVVSYEHFFLKIIGKMLGVIYNVHIPSEL